VQIDLKKRARIVELAKTGLYSQSDIIRIITKEFKQGVGKLAIDKILTKEKLTLPTGFASSASKQSADKSLYLKDYSFEDLETDIKAGKNRQTIAKELYDKDPEYFDKLKAPSKGVKSGIAIAIGDRIKKRPDLNTIDLLNVKKLKNKKKLALQDIQNFINKNKETYKKVYASNKIGAVSNFKEKVLDYISKKYPDLIYRTKGSRNLLANQRLYDGFDILGRKQIKQGEYGKDVALNKLIRKALNIPERSLAGEGLNVERLNRTYNSNLDKLVKEAVNKKIIPKNDPITGYPITDGDSYYRFVNRTQIDPIRNLFGKNFNFGQEHLGGMARAETVNDVETLTRITAMDPIQNKFIKGAGYDTKVTTLVKLAKQSSPDKAKDYIESANEIIEEGNKKFGLEQTKYKIKGNEIKTIQPKANLDDSFFKKAQRAIKSFIATGRDKEDAFKAIDPYLQNAIKVVKKTGEFNPQANSFLRTALRRTGVAGLVGMIGVGMFGGSPVEAAEVSQPQINQPTVSEPLKYDATQGSIVNANTDQKADQNQILEYVKDNPLKVTAGASLGFAAQEVPGAYKAARDLGRGRVRSTLGISGALRPVLTTFGTPLMTGLYEGAIGAKRLDEGETMTDILTDPVGPVLGLSLMEPLSKMSGVVRDAPKRTMAEGVRNYFNLSNVGKARSGITGQILRMGMSPRMIAGASRFLGLPGLALGLGMSGYDAYKNYQNQEGMIYNLFNRDE